MRIDSESFTALMSAISSIESRVFIHLVMSTLNIELVMWEII